jgi:hypothetical protein
LKPHSGSGGGTPLQTWGKKKNSAKIMIMTTIIRVHILPEVESLAISDPFPSALYIKLIRMVISQKLTLYNKSAAIGYITGMLDRS